MNVEFQAITNLNIIDKAILKGTFLLPEKTDM